MGKEKSPNKVRAQPNITAIGTTPIEWDYFFIFIFLMDFIYSETIKYNAK